jgi:hypothetical protein
MNKNWEETNRPTCHFTKKRNRAIANAGNNDETKQ